MVQKLSIDGIEIEKFMRFLRRTIAYCEHIYAYHRILFYNLPYLLNFNGGPILNVSCHQLDPIGQLLITGSNHELVLDDDIQGYNHLDSTKRISPEMI